MSGRAGLEAAPGGIEHVPADVAVVWIASDQRPLRGGAGLADWRLCGRLSRTLVRGRLTGAAGEAALLPSAGALRAPALLVLGLGPVRGIGARELRDAVADAIARARQLRARGVLLDVPLPAPEISDGAAAEALLEGVARGMAGAEADLLVRLHAAGGRAERIGAAGLAGLDEAAARGLPLARVRREAAPPVRTRRGPGAPRPSEAP